MKNTSFIRKRLPAFLLILLIIVLGLLFYSNLLPTQTSTISQGGTTNAPSLQPTRPQQTATTAAQRAVEGSQQPISPISPLLSSPLISTTDISATPTLPITPTQLATEIQAYTFEIVNKYPHDPLAFTQGLIYYDGMLYEGTGLNGRSSLRKVDLESGNVLEQVNLAPDYFGEGITLWDNRIIQLTWQSHRGFIWEIDNNFTPVKDYQYPTEGWGITHDDKQLIMSDGSDTLYFWDPAIMTDEATEPTVLKELPVRANGEPVIRLNELEYIKGAIYANVWQTDLIAQIDPTTGNVLGWIDLAGLLTPQERANSDVLNGIAYDPEQDRLFITGKLWPALFEIKLIPVDSSK